MNGTNKRGTEGGFTSGASVRREGHWCVWSDLGRWEASVRGGGGCVCVCVTSVWRAHGKLIWLRTKTKQLPFEFTASATLLANIIKGLSLINIWPLVKLHQENPWPNIFLQV